MNVNETQVLVVTRSSMQVAADIKINDERLKQVMNYKYLGSIVSEDGRCDIDKKKTRILIAKNI